MHIHTLQKWKHRHRYNIEDGHGERNTRRVIVLTLSMMIIEIAAGYLFGSMALLADGWHMGTHAVALGIQLQFRDRKGRCIGGFYQRGGIGGNCNTHRR
jgi:Co/Zn/Cd efflux system component